MEAPFDHVLQTVDELRELYRMPSKVVARKKAAHMDDVTRAFIAGSPFVLMATAGADGTCDVSPRAARPGSCGCSTSGVSPYRTSAATTCSTRS